MSQQMLSPEEAAAYRRAGLQSMLEALCHYQAAGEPARIIVYPGGGWAIENPANDANEGDKQ